MVSAGGFEWIHAFAAAIAAAIPGLGVIKSNRDRSRKNKRQLEGDPDDPNAEGVLKIAYETREQVEELDSKVEEVRDEARQNRRIIVNKLDSMNGTGETEFMFDGGDGDDD